MGSSHRKTLEGARILILEDEFFLADDLARALDEAGGRVVGPVATVEQAENLMATETLDAAILDLNLRGEVAAEFIGRIAATGLPCLIVSGYGFDALPDSVQGVPRLEKPVSAESVIEALADELERVV